MHTPSRTSINPELLWNGFEHPAQQSQQAFRQIMQAMAEPGTLASLAVDPIRTQLARSENKLSPAMFVTALTLLDQDTPIYLSQDMQGEAFTSNLKFHCGCPIVTAPEQSLFAFVSLNEWQSTTDFHQGSEDYPHLSTTLIIEVDHLREIKDAPSERNEHTVLQLSGPGIQSNRYVELSHLSDAQRALFEQNHQRSPQGVDFIFICGETLMAIPRTTVCAAHYQTAILEENQLKEANTCM